MRLLQLSKEPNMYAYAFNFDHPDSGKWIGWAGTLGLMCEFWRYQKRNQIKPPSMALMDADDWVAFPAAWLLGQMIKAMSGKIPEYPLIKIERRGGVVCAVFYDDCEKPKVKYKVFLEEALRPAFIEIEDIEQNVAYRIEIVEGFR